MVKVILRKSRFLVRTKTFSHIDEEGRACYKPTLTLVCGKTFEYLGYKWGIYRKDHTRDRKRKNDYVMLDLTTGLPVRIDSRRVNILEDLELASFKYEIKEYMKDERHAKNVKIYDYLKRGVRK